MDKEKQRLNKPNKEAIHVFAIIRIDAFQPPDVPLESKITVKKVVWTQEIAEQEVERLNKLNTAKGALYFWQITRLEKSLFNKT